MSHVLIDPVPNLRRIPSFVSMVSLVNYIWHDCEMHAQLHKKVSPNFKTFTKWMKDVSTNSVNLVGGIDTRRCVDMVLISILDDLHVHGIEEHVLSWKALP